MNRIFQCVLTTLFLCVTISAQETTLPLWDFSTPSTTLKLVTFSDEESHGLTTFNFSTANQTGKLTYSLDQGEYEWEPYAGLTIKPKGESFDASAYSAIQFRHRGCGLSFSAEMLEISDYAFHNYVVKPSKEWKTETIVFNRDLRIPEWSNDTTLRFSANELTGFGFRASGKSTEQGSFEIDDLVLLKNAPTNQKRAKPNNFISFSPNATDFHEPYLDRFDSLGVSVMLGVESGNADLVEVMDKIMNQYGHHKSVIGYCIDIEWVKKGEMEKGCGRPITDSIAKLLDIHLKTSYGRSDLKLVLKHWDTKWLPQTYRSDIIFINDGQIFDSFDEQFSWMTKWYSFIPTNPILFQIGYPSDYKWWKSMKNPIQEIGEQLTAAKNPRQKSGVLWVDFTVNYPEVNLLRFNPTDSVQNPATRLTKNDFTPAEGSSSVDFAGIRSSTYGGQSWGREDQHPYRFPTVASDRWSFAVRNITKAFGGASPLVLWAVGQINTETNECMLEFPEE